MAKISLYFAKIKDFIVNAYKTNRKLFFVCVSLFFVVIASICVYFSQGKNLKNNDSKTSLNVLVDDYASMVEQKIESILLGLKSVSKVDVFVMVDSSEIANYLTEKEVVEVTGSAGTTTTTTTTVVYQKDGSKSTPILVSTTPPKIVGVLIFLNKIDASTKLSISNAVADVLNIDASCISILQDS